VGASLAVLALAFMTYYSAVALLASAFRADQGGTAKLAYAAYCLVLAPFLVGGAARLTKGRGGLRGLGLVPVEGMRVWGWGALTGLLGAAGNLLIFLFLSQAARLLGGRHLQSQDALTLARLRGPWLVLVFISACLVAPFCEELFFRGVLYTSMRNRWGKAAATLASAAVFSFLHFKWEGLPSLFFLGALFAVLYERSGSLWPCMLAHSFNNLLALAVLLSL